LKAKITLEALREQANRSQIRGPLQVVDFSLPDRSDGLIEAQPPAHWPSAIRFIPTRFTLGKQLLDQVARAFEDGNGHGTAEREREIERLHAKIGQLFVAHGPICPGEGEESDYPVFSDYREQN
jgi:hypothetical protein